MYIAMNRFKIRKGSEDAFEQVWATRESYLNRMAGSLEFHLLRGPEEEDHTLYATHTVWQSKAAFEMWTKSDEFRASHARANTASPSASLYLEHPKFEGFDVRQTQSKESTAARSQPLGAAQSLGGFMTAVSASSLTEQMAADPAAVIEDVARELGVTQRAVVEALPEHMRTFCPGSSFVDAMIDVANWGDVTLIITPTTASWRLPGPSPLVRSCADITTWLNQDSMAT